MPHFQIQLHTGMIASHNCYRFVSCMFMPPSTTSLLDSGLVTREVIEVLKSRHVFGTSLRRLCDMVHYHATCSHGKMEQL